MPEAGCPFTSAAVACESAITRACGWAEFSLLIGAEVDPANTETVKSLRALHRDSERIIDSLGWMRDFAIQAAMHPDEVLRFMEALSAGRSYEEAERIALPTERRRRAATTAPVPSAVAVLDVARARA